MAVESLAPGALVYYAVPPEQPDNALSRWWHGFTGKRSPYAQALFAERLKAMSPDNQFALIQQLYKQRTDLLTGAAQVDAQAAQAKAMLGQSDATREGNWLAYWSNVNAAAIRAGADVSVAKAGLGGKLLMNRDLQAGTAQVVTDFQRQMYAAAAQEIDNPEGAQNTIREAIRELDRQSGALRAVPGQQDALGQALTGVQYPFIDGPLRDKVRSAATAVAPVPPEIQIPELSAPGARAPGGMPSFSPSPRGAGQPPGQAPAAAAAGSAVSGTTAPPTQESPGLYGGAPSTGIPRTDAGDTLRASAEQISQRITELEAKVRDPAAVLGDLTDPFPGLGGAPRKRSAADMAAELAPAAAERKALASPRVPLPWAYDRPAPVVSVATGAPAEPAAAPVPKPAAAAAPKASPAPVSPAAARTGVPQVISAAENANVPIDAFDWWRGPQVTAAYEAARAANQTKAEYEDWRRQTIMAYIMRDKGYEAARLPEWAAVELPGYAPRE